jgi:hypothetical protein
VEDIGKLTQQGVDNNAKDEKGLTAQEIVLLIKNEANVNRADWKGKKSLV